MKNLIYSWISFHGITDLLLPFHYWFPTYTLSTISTFLPMNVLNSITFSLSCIHFSYDLLLTIPQICLSLFFLLSYGKSKWSQSILLSYMSLIHVPIHFMNINLTFYTLLLLMTTFIIFYHCSLLMNTLDLIVMSGGPLPNNIKHKLLLGVINAHIITNLLQYSQI
jgi:hypothetical protein